MFIQAWYKYVVICNVYIKSPYTLYTHVLYLLYYTRSYTSTYYTPTLYYSSKGAMNVVRLTTDHRPDIPEERARVESEGGRVKSPGMCMCVY